MGAQQPSPGPSEAGRSLSIAIVASTRFPIREPFAGGLEAHTHLLAKSLRERGHRVSVFASDDSDPELGYEPICAPSRALELSDAAREDVSMPAPRFLEEHHAYLTLMLDLRGRSFDIVHNNSLHYLPIAMADALRAPVVTSLHTPPTPWLESALRARRSTPAAGRFVAVSHATARAWAGTLDASVIHNGVDVDFWRPRAGERLRQAVWSGRIVPEKAPHLAIDAARRAGIPLEFAGPIGDTEYFRRAVEPRLGPGVNYAGHLDRAELAELLGRSSVFVFSPCWEEPFGLVLGEALACGLPVAAWRRGAVEELIGHECGRIADPGDIDGLASAIGSAVDEVDPQSCREVAVQRLASERMVDQYEALYLRLADAPAPYATPAVV
ncbi:glycosyltransferase family 4 protein [Thermoleophilia bacterium SCSIO 60948]|nr:glycosyltransferase family 4 protein [Thermoleophilia bacterium SCSIO 60948]